MRDTTHYSGRDYDQVCSANARLQDERSKIKATLISRLTEALRGQDEDTMKNVFITVNEVLN